MIRLSQLLNEETFTAINKKTGKTSVFKSKDSRDAAVKAGTHDKDEKAAKGGDAPAAEKPNMFSKDAGYDAPDTKSTSNQSNLDSAYDAKDFESHVESLKGKIDDSEYEDIKGEMEALKYMQMDMQDLDDAGEDTYNEKIEIDSAVEELKDRINAAMASSKKTKVSEPKPDEPTAEPKQQRQVNPDVNKATKAKAEELGITPQKLGKDEYQKKMAQAAYQALTDANFHSEARELIAKLEGKPELAEKPDYPSLSDPKFKEKMNAIRTKYASEYSDNVDDDARELGVSVSQESSWSGDDAVDGIAFTLRMNGFHKLADTIQSVIKESVSTKLTSLIKK